MAQIPVNEEYFTFIRGLITEAGPFTFPENASLDEDNFVLNKKGYRQRRLGIDYITGTTPEEISIGNYADAAISTYLWEGAGGVSSNAILCVQTGRHLRLYNAATEIITDELLGVITFSSTEAITTSIFQYATTAGRLIIVTGAAAIFQIVYDAPSTFTVHEHGLLVRDLWGVQDQYVEKYRVPDSEVTWPEFDERWYNLINRGWGAPHAAEAEAPVAPSNYAILFEAEHNVWPNLQDVVTAGIDVSTGSFDADQVTNSSIGGSSAPIGSSIIDIFNRGGSRQHVASGLSIINNYYYGSSNNGWGKTLSVYPERILYGSYTKNGRYALSPLGGRFTDILDLPEDRTTGGIRCLASYAGRMFYSGFNSETVDGDAKSPNLGSYIAFSQVVTAIDSIGKCFQEGDPTSLNESDLLETDGGTLQIPQVNDVKRLVAFGKSLLVFASNGVWAVTGGFDSSFSATSYSVNKVTDAGLVGANTIVEVEDRIYYWSDSGIYVVQTDSTGLNLSINNITSSTIQTFYNNILSLSKEKAIGIYSPDTKVVHWIFNGQDDYETIYTNYHRYDRQLNLDIDLSAFYTYTFHLDDRDGSAVSPMPAISGIFSTPNYFSKTFVEQVVVGEDDVQADSEDVVIEIHSTSTSTSRIAYLSIQVVPSAAEINLTTSRLNNTSFKDWVSADDEGVSFSSYLETGFETLGDSQRQKQGQYVTVHMERTETGFDIDLDPLNPSSCLMTTKWDFANHVNSGKISDPVQVYRLRRNYIPSGSGDAFNYGQSVITSKNKIRGRGRALVLKFESEAEKDCILYGWGTTFKVNPNA